MLRVSLFYVIDYGSTESWERTWDCSGDGLYTLRRYSDAGCACLPLNLLGAPLSIRISQMPQSAAEHPSPSWEDPDHTLCS